MPSDEIDRWGVAWKYKLTGTVEGKWTKFAMVKARASMAFADSTSSSELSKIHNKHFSKQYTGDDGTRIRIRGHRSFGQWVVELIIDGTSGGKAFYPIASELELRPLYITADKAAPAWPPFNTERTAYSSTYQAWEFVSQDIVGARRVWGSDSGTLTPIYIDTGLENPSLGNIYNNWWEAYWLFSGLGGGGGAFPTSLTSIWFNKSPAYVAALSAYTAYWTAYQASLGPRKIRLFTGWGEELASTSPYGDTYTDQTNMNKENWSGGDYLQLWSYPYVEGADYSVLNWTKDDRLIFTPPYNTSVPTEEFGWNSEYPIPSVAVRTVVSDTNGRFSVRYGLNNYGDRPYSKSVVDGVTYYNNYPDSFDASGWFSQLLNGNSVDGVSTTTIDQYAEVSGFTRDADPWADARAEWNAARAAAPGIFAARQSSYETGQLLTALESGVLPDYVRRKMRLGPSSSRRLVAAGDPTLSVTRTHVTSDDGKTTTYTYTLTFAYGPADDRVSTTWTGQRTDRETTHVLKRYGSGAPTAATLTVLTQTFTNWCNVTADSDPVVGRRVVGGQYNEPGTSYASRSLDIYDKTPFWIDGTSSDEEAQPLFAVVNGVRAFVTNHVGSWESGTPVMPYSTSGNSQGYFDVPLPYPTVAAANPPLPDWFVGVPELEVTALPAYVTYRSLYPPNTVLTKDLVYGPPEEPGLPPSIINDPSFLDTRPSKDTVLYLYVSTTSDGEDGAPSLFPVESSKRTNTMTLRHVYACSYTYATGRLVITRDVLTGPYVFPAYAPDMPHVVALVAGKAPPVDVGEYFRETEEEQYKRFPQYRYPYEDPTLIRLDDGTLTGDRYLHLSDYLEADAQPFEPQYPAPGEYRVWAVQAWYYRQLLAVPLSDV